jgi:signal transduction histidine kinase
VRLTLAQFINTNIDSILTDWEAFALTLQPAAATMTELALRNHAREILQAMARDIERAQTDVQQSDKSKGWAPVLEGAETAAATHGALRHLVGFDLLQLAAEYRALRASVVRLWQAHLSTTQDAMLIEMTRFNEAVDQALAESITRYSGEMARSRDTFLAILGHDLRSPLSAVSMSAQYLAISGKGGSEEQSAVLRINQSVLTMSLMIRDLLEYTRTRLGRGIPVVPLPYDLAQICEAAHDEVQAAHPDCVFDLELAGDLRGQFDPARLGQVLSNLLNNAVQHGAQGQPITLRAHGEPDAVLIQVMNQGSVIPPDVLQDIFNPLVQFRSEDPTAPAPLSTSLGLGLFIAREIVVAHGGHLRVESSHAAGTVFSIELPRSLRDASTTGAR